MKNVSRIVLGQCFLSLDNDTTTHEPRDLHDPNSFVTMGVTCGISSDGFTLWRNATSSEITFNSNATNHQSDTGLQHLLLHNRTDDFAATLSDNWELERSIDCPEHTLLLSEFDFCLHSEQCHPLRDAWYCTRGIQNDLFFKYEDERNFWTSPPFSRVLAFFHKVSYFRCSSIAESVSYEYMDFDDMGTLIPALAVIMVDLFDYQIDFIGTGQILSFYHTGWHELTQNDITGIRYHFLSTLYDLVTLQKLDIHPRTKQYWIGTLTSWLLAVLIVMTWLLYQYVKKKLWQRWFCDHHACQRCSTHRIPTGYKRRRAPPFFRSLVLGCLILSGHATKPLETYLLCDVEDASMTSGYTKSSQAGEEAFNHPNGEFGFEILRHSEESLSCLNLTLCRVENNDYEQWLDRDTSSTISDFCERLDCSRGNAKSATSCLLPSRLTAPSYYDTSSVLGHNEVEPTEPVDGCQDPPAEREDVSLMQRPVHTSGETCGEHLDPLVYWDRLSFTPPIVTRQFYTWLTDVTRIGQLQTQLYTVPWDGRTCVTCAFTNTVPVPDTNGVKGPYYIRPQPQLLGGVPILHFMALTAAKADSFRAFHVKMNTPSGTSQGTIILNSFAGIVTTALLFDSVLPLHGCRTTSWCRARWRTAGGFHLAWWPSPILVLDYSQVELDEFPAPQSVQNLVISGPPASSYTSPQVCPDPGGTAYDHDDQSLLFTGTRRLQQHKAERLEADNATWDEVSLMHIPRGAASRSHSSARSENGDNALARSNSGSSSESSDALVIYSKSRERMLVPIDADLAPDLYKLVVAHFLSFASGSDDWNALSLHPIRPRPADIALCVLPFMAIFRGEHTMDRAFVLIDLEMHSNEIDICGEKQEPHIVREVWEVPITINRPTFLHWIGVQPLCRNIAYPCLVELGDHPWLQQDSRAHTMLDGLYIRVIINVPRPRFSLMLYLEYSRHDIPLANMFTHWQEQLAISAQRLRNMFAPDDDELMEAARETRSAHNTDTASSSRNSNEMTEEELESDVTGLMARSPMSTGREQSIQPERSDMVIYEFQHPPQTSLIDPSLTRSSFRETVGALMDVPNPSAMWDNFEIHQVRPLPSNLDPLHVVAYIFVHPATMLQSMSFVLVQISVTHEATTCGRFETATERAVHRIPAFLSREAFLTNTRTWDLCTNSGADQCDVRLPDRIWDRNDHENRLLFDGAFVQIRCLTPYHDVPVQQQLRDSQSGMSAQDMIDSWFGGTTMGTDALTLLQLQTSCSWFTRPTGYRDRPPPYSLHRDVTTGLRPPGNPQVFNIASDDEEETEQLQDKVPSKVVQLAELLAIPTPCRAPVRVCLADTLPPAGNDNLSDTGDSAHFVFLGDDSTKLQTLLEFDEIHDLPSRCWQHIQEIPDSVRDTLNGIRLIDLQHWTAIDAQEYAVYTDGTFDGHRAAWAAVLFVMYDGNWQLLGYLAAPLPQGAFQCDRQTALMGEQSALFAAAWWLLKFICFVQWQGPITFYWDCVSAGGKAKGDFNLNQTVLDQKVRNVFQALEAYVGVDLILHQHVKAHSGIVENEFVDILTRWANKEDFVIAPSSARILDVLLDDEITLEWLWLCTNSITGDLPPFTDGKWTWNRHSRDEVDVDRVIQTSTQCSTGQLEKANWKFSLQTGSYNCLTLGADGEGLPSLNSRASLLRQQVDQKGYHLLGLQETRTPRGTIRSRSHLRLCSGCQEDHTLGIELWVSLTLPFAYQPDGKPCCFRPEDFAIILADPRQLVVHVSNTHLELVVAVIHAPHSGTCQVELENWWSQLHENLQRHAPSMIVLMDANQRLVHSCAPFVGELTEQPRTLETYYLQNFLQQLDLMAPATFGTWHSGPIYTWTHPGKKSQSRIDYVLIPSSWSWSTIFSWVDPEVHAGHGAVDHQCTSLTVKWHALAPRSRDRRGKYDQDRMLLPESRHCLEQILQSAPTFPWDMHATEHAAALTEYFQAQLQVHFPRAKRLRHWRLATQGTLDCFHELTHLKRYVRSYTQMIDHLWLRFTFDRWTHRTWTESNLRWASQVFQQSAVYGKQLPMVASKLTKLVRQDKRAHLEEVAKMAATADIQDVFRHLRPVLPTRKTQRNTLQPLPQVLQLNGELTQTKAELADRWFEHFASIEAGTRADPQTFFREALTTQAHQCLPSHWTEADLPTLKKLEAAIRRSGWRRAVGLDNLPHELYKVCPRVAARLLYPLACKFTLRLQEPIQWKGGQLFALHKGRGSFQNCTSFRSIMLLSTAGKIVRSSLRQTINEAYVSGTDGLQLGGKPAQQVLFGSQAVRNFVSWQRQMNRSCAIVFCDVASAFYAALREVATGASTSDYDIACIVKHFQLDPDVMPQLYDALKGHTAHEALHATPASQAYLRESLCHTWFSLDSDHFAHTRRGTRPGDAWADVVFNILFARVIQKVRDHLQEHGLLVEIRPPELRDFWPGRTTFGDGLPLYHATWADDLALMLSLSTPMGSYQRSWIGKWLPARRFGGVWHESNHLGRQDGDPPLAPGNTGSCPATSSLC